MGERSLDSWRKNHTEFFARECARIGVTPAAQMPVVCEQFRVVFRGLQGDLLAAGQD